MKWGKVAIVGRPNVGKSTLLNAMLGEKVAIVSDKPQTTRTRILGVVHRPNAQIVLLDTPGLHKPRYMLNRRMVKTAMETMREADLVYVMVEATGPPGAGDRFVIEEVTDLKVPLFLLINKVDIVNKTRLLPLIDIYRKMANWTEVVPLSALTKDNVDRLLELTVQILPEGEAPYGEDMLTDQPMRVLAGELIREKVLQQTTEELPYSVAVIIEQFIEEGNLARIHAIILVEKETQKPIIIGKHGDRLKAIGTAARQDMERLFGMKVFLELWVKVKESWRHDEGLLGELGY
jgi:GTP-binding protein Era